MRAIKTDPRIRKAQIFRDAMLLAERIGHKRLTRDSVATEARVSGPLVAKYFRNMNRLREAVLREAIKRENLSILSHCVADEALLSHPTLRRNTLEYISAKL